jgi:hypothetical protein
VATLKGADPVRLVRSVLTENGNELASVQEVRATVEDAFVSMVREELA